MRSSFRVPELALWLLALAPVASLAALHIPYPFATDQALFTYAARALHDGARLYVDFWDMKQPGVYWFYELGGGLFGFDEIGIHTFEALWMLATACVVTLIAKRILKHPWLPYLAPLLCFGPFYASASYLRLTMVEIVVSLPVSVFVLCLLQRDHRRSPWAVDVIAGFAAVGIAFMKLVLTLIPMALLVTYWVVRGSGTPHAGAAPTLLRHAGHLAAGAIAAALLFSAPLIADGSLGIAIWTAFVYPAEAIAAFPHAPPERLARAYYWLAHETWYLMPLAACGMVGLWNARLRPASALLLAWLVAAAAAIQMQVLSHWIYHMNLFFLPLGLAALIGVEVLASFRAETSRPILRIDRAELIRIVLSLALVAAVALHVYLGVLWGLVDRRVWNYDSVAEFQWSVAPELKELRESVAFLAESDSVPGPIGVLGDPRVVILSGRAPVLEINSWGYYLPNQLNEAAARLRRIRPPYVYLSPYQIRIISNGSTALLDALRDLYREHSQDATGGVWYALK